MGPGYVLWVSWAPTSAGCTPEMVLALDLSLTDVEGRRLYRNIRLSKSFVPCNTEEGCPGRGWWQEPPSNEMLNGWAARKLSWGHSATRLPPKLGCRYSVWYYLIMPSLILLYCLGTASYRLEMRSWLCHLSTCKNYPILSLGTLLASLMLPCSLPKNGTTKSQEDPLCNYLDHREMQGLTPTHDWWWTVNNHCITFTR